LIANLVAPLLPIVLQLLAIFDSAWTIVGEILTAIGDAGSDPRSYSGSDASPNPRPAGAGAIRNSTAPRPRGKLRGSIAAVLEEVARGSAPIDSTAGPDRAGRGAGKIQKVAQVSCAGPSGYAGSGPRRTRVADVRSVRAHVAGARARRAWVADVRPVCADRTRAGRRTGRRTRTAAHRW
jgi:hypothetical protein